METERKISFNWAATIALLVATLAIAIFATAYKLPQIYKYEKDIAGRNRDEVNTEFLKKSTILAEDEAPYLETGIDDIYYTANYDGDITFFKFVDGQYEKVKTSSTEKVLLPGVEDKKETTIYFYTVKQEKDKNSDEEPQEISVGIGVYKNRKSLSYPYAFIKVIPNTITENYDYIAFVDYDIEDYYSTNKEYDTAYVFSKGSEDFEEIYSLNGKNDSSIPVDLIQSRGDGFYYFVKNEGEGDDEGYSLYIKTTVTGGDVVISSNIALPYAFCKDGNLLLLEYAKVYRGVVDLEKSTKFCLSAVTGIEADVIMEFKDEPANYIVKGDYLFNANEQVLYDVLGETEQPLSSAVTIENIQDIAVSEGGAKLAIAGDIGTEQSKLFFYEFATNKIQVVGGKDLFLPGCPNLHFEGDYVTFLTPASNSDVVTNVVIPWKSIIA